MTWQEAVAIAVGSQQGWARCAETLFLSQHLTVIHIHWDALPCSPARNRMIPAFRIMCKNGFLVLVCSS